MLETRVVLPLQLTLQTLLRLWRQPSVPAFVLEGILGCSWLYQLQGGLLLAAMKTLAGTLFGCVLCKDFVLFTQGSAQGLLLAPLSANTPGRARRTIGCRELNRGWLRARKRPPPCSVAPAVMS